METNPVYKDYHGNFYNNYIVKLNCKTGQICCVMCCYLFSLATRLYPRFRINMNFSELWLVYCSQETYRQTFSCAFSLRWAAIGLLWSGDIQPLFSTFPKAKLRLVHCDQVTFPAALLHEGLLEFWLVNLLRSFPHPSPASIELACLPCAGILWPRLQAETKEDDHRGTMLFIDLSFLYQSPYCQKFPCLL